jgi:UDP-glucose 4-epimerase
MSQSDLATGGASTAVNLATGNGYSVREIIAAVAKAGRA